MFVSYVLKRWIWIQGLERGRLEEDRLQYDGRVIARRGECFMGIMRMEKGYRVVRYMI